jgi:predicted MFS family arabinose efflux permease
MLNNNLDVYLKQIGGFSNDHSKLLTILAPICTIIGPIITAKLCDKFDFIKTATILFAISLAFAVAVFFLYDNGAYLGLSLIVFFLILANGARSISLSIAAVKVRNKIDTGVYATTVNSVASLTCGLAPKLGSIILDRQSFSIAQNWSTVFLILLVVNALIVGILIAVLLLLKRKNKKLKNANA